MAARPRILPIMAPAMPPLESPVLGSPASAVAVLEDVPADVDVVARLEEFVDEDVLVMVGAEAVGGWALSWRKM